MIFTISGPKSCGKSKIAEIEAIRKGLPVTYIGTLPKLPVNKKRIENHKKRRPMSWKLVEAIGYLKPIEDEFKNLLSRSIILDGFTVLVILTIMNMDVCYDEDEWINYFKTFLLALFNQVNLNNNYLWIVTNNSPINDFGEEIKMIVGEVNNFIYQFSDINHIIKK